MSGIMFRRIFGTSCLCCVLTLCNLSLAQSKSVHEGQSKRISVLKRESSDKSGVQLNAPKVKSNVSNARNSAPKVIANPYVSDFNPLELMDARPIGSAAIPQESQQFQPSQRTPDNFVQSKVRQRQNSYTIARLSDQPVNNGIDEIKSPAELTKKTGPSILSSSSHFSMAQLEAKVAGPASLLAGEFGQYNILVRNVSPHFAENTELLVDLPKGSRIKTEKSFKPTQTGTGVLFKLGKIRPNQPLVIPFQLALPIDGAVQVAAYIRYSGSTELTVDVSRQKSSNIEIIGADSANVGESLTYALMVTNDSASAANFSVRAKMPRGLKLTVLDRNAHFDRRTGLTTWTIRNLAPGSAETVQFKTDVVGAGRLTIMADVLKGNRQIGNHSFTTSVNR